MTTMATQKLEFHCEVLKYTLKKFSDNYETVGKEWRLSTNPQIFTYVLYFNQYNINIRYHYS